MTTTLSEALLLLALVSLVILYVTQPSRLPAGYLVAWRDDDEP